MASRFFSEICQTRMVTCGLWRQKQKLRRFSSDIHSDMLNTVLIGVIERISLIFITNLHLDKAEKELTSRQNSATNSNEAFLPVNFLWMMAILIHLLSNERSGFVNLLLFWFKNSHLVLPSRQTFTQCFHSRSVHIRFLRWAKSVYCHLTAGSMIDVIAIWRWNQMSSVHTGEHLSEHESKPWFPGGDLIISNKWNFAKFFIYLVAKEPEITLRFQCRTLSSSVLKWCNDGQWHCFTSLSISINCIKMNLL